MRQNVNIFQINEQLFFSPYTSWCNSRLEANIYPIVLFWKYFSFCLFRRRLYWKENSHKNMPLFIQGGKFEIFMRLWSWDIIQWFKENPVLLCIIWKYYAKWTTKACLSKGYESINQIRCCSKHVSENCQAVWYKGKQRKAVNGYLAILYLDVYENTPMHQSTVGSASKEPGIPGSQFDELIYPRSRHGQK